MAPCLGQGENKLKSIYYVHASKGNQQENTFQQLDGTSEA